MRESSCGVELKTEKQGDEDVDSVQKERGADAVEMDKEGGGGEKPGGIKEKQSKGKGLRGKKRKADNENVNESEYEKLRRANIKEKEAFLASLDLNDL